MANIDSNQHRPHVVHGRWEFQVEKIALDLGVDLPEDVRSLAHVEGAPIANCDDLRRDLELMEELLVHPVVLFEPQHHHDDLWMPEDRLWPSHHVVHELSFGLHYVLLVIKLDEMGLSHSDLKHIASLSESVEDPISDIVVRAPRTMLVDHHPLLLAQVDGLLDGQSLKRLLVAHHHLV